MLIVRNTGCNTLAALPMMYWDHGHVALGKHHWLTAPVGRSQSLQAMGVESRTSQQGYGTGAEAVDILDSLDRGILVVDQTGRIHFRNTAASLRLPSGDHVSTVFDGTLFLSTFEGWDEELARVCGGDTGAQWECALSQHDGTAPMLARMRCTRMRSKPGSSEPVAVIVVEDGSEVDSTVLEQRLEVSQRLASLGKLAARVAHELNNPLDGILRYVNLAIRVMGDTPEPKLKSYLSESRTGLIRMVQIISELLQFSRQTDGEFDESDINEVVEQAIRSISVAAEAAGVVVAGDFQSQNMPSMRGSRLYQICCNLLKNAVDAMPDGGRVTVTTGVVNEQVVIRVSDTGKGLPDEADRIFEPFFTTKGPGKGTGLGLAICKDFINDMQGTITAETGGEGGAVFIVRIPVSSCNQPGPLGGEEKCGS